MPLEAQVLGDGLLLTVFVLVAIVAGIGSARLFLDASRGRAAGRHPATRDEGRDGGTRSSL